MTNATTSSDTPTEALIKDINSENRKILAEDVPVNTLRKQIARLKKFIAE